VVADDTSEAEEPETYAVRLNHPQTLNDLAEMPPMYVDRLITGLAIAEAQVEAVRQRVVSSAQLDLYDWTV